MAGILGLPPSNLIAAKESVQALCLEHRTQEQRGSVELVRNSTESTGDFESTEEAFCCPDFRVTTWALCIDPPFAKLIRGSWFC